MYTITLTDMILFRKQLEKNRTFHYLTGLSKVLFMLNGWSWHILMFAVSDCMQNMEIGRALE